MGLTRDAIKSYGSPVTSIRVIAAISIVSSILSILRMSRQLLLVPELMGYYLVAIFRGICAILAMAILFKMVSGWRTSRTVEVRTATLCLLFLSAVPLSRGAYALIRPFFWGPSLFEIAMDRPLYVVVPALWVLAGILLIVAAGDLLKSGNTKLELAGLVERGGRHFLISLVFRSLSSIIQHIDGLPHLIRNLNEAKAPAPSPFMLPSHVVVLLASLLLVYVLTRLLRNDLRFDGRFHRWMGLTVITVAVGRILYLPVILTYVPQVLQAGLNVDAVAFVSGVVLSIPSSIIYTLLGLNLYTRSNVQLSE